MDEAKIKYLLAAADAGEVIKIKYSGGSCQGETREILPKDIHDNKLLAHCFLSEMDKTFFVEKITILNFNEKVIHEGTAPTVHTLESIYETHKKAWESTGWQVEFDETSIKLYGHFKNGKPRKSPSYAISFCEETYDYTDFNDVGERVDIYKKSEKPWSVFGNGYSGQFKHLEKAIERFLEITTTDKTADIIKTEDKPTQTNKE